MQKETKTQATANSSKTKKIKKKVVVFTKKKKTKTPESNIINELQEKYNTIDFEAITSFNDVPLSSQTMKGLKKANYTKPTEIQLQTLKYSLKGEDILGAAQTGSGKTLAFLIPLLEILYCHQWTRNDGVGAIVITPTRELAYQIFEELRKIGEFHEFSAGLVIGGKDLKFERDRMDQCNIIICTPGRLLQHMDENPLFNCDNMKLLVLDEADRILDMGFADTMNAIVANLPLVMQTLLFSATQTKSVKDLARLSLKNPHYVSVHEDKEHSTPSSLQQSYLVCELHDKISVLYSFIKNHLKCKSIIFFSSCKQTKYVYEIFCKLRPGTSLMALYGSLHQLRRMEIYEAFCKKTHAVLFATDLAARGLDFPQVNWVVQADCPEDPETYIHRVGRTARYHRGGESLLLLIPSEQAMVDELYGYKIPIEKIDINPDRLTNPVRKIEAYLAKDTQLKDTAQRAFKSYFKAIYLMKNKKVFNVKSLDTVAFAHSMGLAIAPRIRFLEKMVRKDGLKVNNPGDQVYQELAVPNKVIKFESDDEDVVPLSISIHDINKATKTTSKFEENDSEDSDDDMLKIKRADHTIDMPENMEELAITGRRTNKPITKAALAKKLLNKQIVPNKKIVFDEQGDAVVETAKQKQSDFAQAYENEDEGGINIEKAKLVLKEEDQYDKQLFKEKVKAKKKEAKRKLKEQQKAKKVGEEEVDDFGTDDDEDDGSEPDLSWMPDPDQLYGSKIVNIDEDSNYDADGLFDEEERIVEEEKPLKKAKSGKRKDKPGDKQEMKAKKKMKFDNVSSLNVNEAEELAMMLLRK